MCKACSLKVKINQKEFPCKKKRDADDDSDMVMNHLKNVHASSAYAHYKQSLLISLNTFPDWMI